MGAATPVAQSTESTHHQGVVLDGLAGIEDLVEHLVVTGGGELEALADRWIMERGWRCVREVQGSRMELELDDYICRRLYLDGVFERAGTAAVKALVRSGDVVFDVGAINVGRIRRPPLTRAAAAAANCIGVTAMP